MSVRITLDDLESSQCLDPDCGCPSHRAPDLGLLDLWDLDVVQMGLSRLQARLLACLLPPNVTVMHAVLLRRVWGELHLSAEGEHLVSVMLARLRPKLPKCWRIVSIADAGYRLEQST